MTDELPVKVRWSPDKRLTHCICFLTTSYASYKPSIPEFFGAFVFNSIIAWALPYLIAKGVTSFYKALRPTGSAGNLLANWSFFSLAILFGLIVIFNLG
jgi:hypothetical protein